MEAQLLVIMTEKYPPDGNNQLLDVSSLALSWSKLLYLRRYQQKKRYIYPLERMGLQWVVDRDFNGHRDKVCILDFSWARD